MNNYSRVGIKELTEARLDANYYAPRFLENEKILAQCGLSRKRIIEVSGLCNCGATPVDVTYSNEGLGLVRTSDVRPDYFRAERVLRTKDLDLSDLRESVIARPGDLLYTMSGTIGYACVIPDDEMPVSFSNTIARVRIPKQSPYDAHYIAVFFNCHYGYEQSLRLVSGGMQGHVMPNPFKELLVALPNSVAQKYIGDKVRQAERLRAWAKLAETHVNQYHQKLVPQQTGLDFAKRVRVVSPARMSERLDAHFYPGVVDEYLRLHQGKFKQLGKLCATIYNGQTQPETAGSASCKQITVTNLSSSFLGGTPRDVEAPVKKEKFLKAYDILMCNAAHNKSYIGKDLTFVHSEAAILPSTEVMAIRVDRNQVPSSYIRAYLLTKLGYVQIQSTIRGITAHSYPDDMALLDIYAPEVADKDKEEWFACDEKLALAGKACEVATQLTNAAKLLVEALIEGQLTEAELLTAEKALQAGNDRLDRVILSRLNTDGIDGQGPALFGDLDELYQLLSLAEGE
ncbi:restriction endonuclease subunit S [Stutzerimonas stutzeri]|uniref:restriction endonuclease subunit S n=1 Tax=Stutzerimonas stutzeri TaxID=316 RepID=UPI000655EC80|nr:restriction endonuclease subunit S [Stutzerimonas stutzeri]AKN26929.1 HsdS3 [Stutzerimonas stutzeri]